MNDLLLKVHNLEKHFQVKASAFSNKKLTLRAVNKVSIDLKRGETLGLVGESGCGKTTIGRSLTRIYEPDGGRVFLNPQQAKVDEVLALDAQWEDLIHKADELEGQDPRAHRQEIRHMRAEAKAIKRKADHMASSADLLVMPPDHLKQARRNIQMVFQDPWASLNPRMIVKDLIAEGPREYKTHTGRDIDTMVQDLLKKVGLPSVAAHRYPHEFSGGQRQRIGIARALALNPSLIVCDEPVSALDVSVQAQVLNLLISLQDDYDLTYIFIAHDLSVVQYISDRVAVMYLGNMVEIADSKTLYTRPRHPYTVSLLGSVPIADPDARQTETILEGDVPSPVNPPSGCPFHPRCPRRIDICSEVIPTYEEKEPGHSYACHNPEPV